MPISKINKKSGMPGDIRGEDMNHAVAGGVS
jgi:hypothetical protein